MAEQITVSALVNAPVDTVWRCYTEPEHIVEWNTPSPDWHTTKADNDVRTGGKFNSRMEAKDGSTGFDFAGTYDEVVPQERLAYTMGDGRKATVVFAPQEQGTQITVAFDPENENPIEMQRDGWQAILNSFKTHTESAH